MTGRVLPLASHSHSEEAVVFRWIVIDVRRLVLVDVVSSGRILMAGGVEAIQPFVKIKCRIGSV